MPQAVEIIDVIGAGRLIVLLYPVFFNAHSGMRIIITDKQARYN